MVAKGRPTDYSETLAADICEQIADGSNLNRICAQDGYPRRTTVYRWLRQYEDFYDSYTRAREDRADARADKIDDVILKIESGEMKPDAARVIIDALKWQAGKEKPQSYGDKVEHDLKGDLTVNIHGTDAEL